MIYELNVFTCRPGGNQALAQLDGTVGREIRGDRFGTLAGCWLTEHGALNRMMQLWSYDSVAEQARLSQALAQDGRWSSEYLEPARELLLRRETKILESFLPFEAPEAAAHVYEYRAYRPCPGMARAWCRLFVDAIPVRRRYGGPVCAWVEAAGHTDGVSHLWAYLSLDERLELRAQAAQDPEWQAFVKQSGMMLEEMTSTVMLPAGHSPCC